MSDERWEEQFKQFLRKTGDDFRRKSEDIKAEAQKLLDAAMDPEKQQKVRDRLNELTQWARKTAQDVAGKVEEAATKAGTAFQRATEKVTGTGAQGPTPPAAAPPAPTPRAPVSAPPAKKAGSAKASPGKPRRKSSGKRKR
jgi:DNA primase